MIYNVMYHYIRDDTKDFPFFRNLTTSNFRSQLDFFKKKFPVISPSDFVESINNKPAKGIVLTFDDGLKDHYENVLPELQKRKMWGYFFIPTNILNTKKVLPVHKIHFLIGKCPSKIILNKALKEIDNKMLDKNVIKLFDKEIYKDQDNNKTEYLFKRLFNYYLKSQFRDKILDSIFSQYFDEEEIFKSLYLTRKEIQELSKLGNIIGSHGVNHKVLSKLSYKEQDREIYNSFYDLDKIIDIKIKSFCYPYGLESTYNEDTIKILKKNKVHHAFVIGNKPMKFDKPIKKYSLPRFDCNQF